MSPSRRPIPDARALLRALALPACVAALGVTTAAPAQAALTFDPPVVVAGPDQPEAIALADLDGDGILDAAIGNRDSPFPDLGKQGGITVMRGTPAGLVPVAGSPFAVGHNLPVAVRAGDMDGDGDQDLVSAASVGSDGAAVSVLLNDGAGSFAPAVGSPYPTTTDGPASASGLALHDMDGNGTLDPIVGADDEIAVLPNAGSGVLGAADVSSIGFESVASFAVGDFVGDADPDIVTTSSGETANLMEGDGTSLTFDSLIDPVGTDVLAADLDGVGRDDLIFARINNDDITTRLSTGDGTFSEPTTTDAGVFFVNEMARADLDADGRPDLAVAAKGGIPLLAGGIGPALSPFPASPIAAGDFHTAVAIGDVTGDAQPDVIGSDFDFDRLTVARNANVGQASGPASVDAGLATVGGAPNDRTVTITSSGTGFLRTGPATVPAGSGFSVLDDGCAGTTLIVGGTCEITVRFAPTVEGPAAAALSVPDNAGGSAAVPMVGTGIVPTAPPVPPALPGAPGLPGTPSPVPVSPDTTRPVVSLAKLTPATFAVARSSTARLAASRKAPRRGTRISYRLSEDARVTLTFERRATGRRKGGRCVAPTRALRRSKARTCTRFVRVGAITRRAGRTGGKAGANRIAFSGRIGRTALKVGRHRVAITAVDAAGNRTRVPSRAAFRIVKGR